MDPVERITRAVLYEGYILWPYRRSALKNRQRWTFGGVFPRSYSEAGHADDPWRMRTECLLEASAGATVDVELRFLQVTARQAMQATEGGAAPVDRLVVGADEYLTWEEATERGVRVPPIEVTDAEVSVRVPVSIPADRATETIAADDGSPAGALVREWRQLEGEIAVTVTPVGAGRFSVAVGISNTTPWSGGERGEAVKQALISAHMVLRTSGGAFVSLTDPPAELREAAARCRNAGTWPVLVGEPGDRTTVLSSPIILPDYPEIAPESPGDLFDGGEIDQMLILNVLSLTDDEKREMRGSDPRAREILDRCASLTPDQLMRLYGSIRELGPVAG